MPQFPSGNLPGTVWFGGCPDEVGLGLWVQGDTLDPEAISQALGSAPTRSKRKGDPIVSSSGEVMRIARTGSWFLSYQVSADTTVAQAIQAMFDGLTDDRSVWRSLTSRYNVELVCELTLKCFNRGWAIPPEIMGHLASRGVTLSFDVSYMGDLQERDTLLNRMQSAEQSSVADRRRD